MVINSKYSLANTASTTGSVAAGSTQTATNSTNSNFTGTKYSVIQYPADLGLERYPHYMMFYINVNGKSQLGRSDSNLFTTDYTKNTAGLGSGESQTIPSTTTNTNSTTTVNEPTGESDSIVKSAIEFAKDKLANFTNSTKRLSTAICLPIPNNVSHSYGAEYRQATSGMLGTALRQIQSGQGYAKATKDAIGAVGMNAPAELSALAGAGLGRLVAKVTGGSGAGGTIAGAIGGYAASDNFSQIIAKMSGLAKNENAEQVFQRVEMRNFQFDWVFIPKNKSESDQINAIIRIFKERMHPELDSNENFLVMPDEFDIEFRYLTGENAYLGKIATSVITRCVVNSTPLGHFAAYDGVDAPVAIQLSLMFQEVEPLHRGMVQAGF